MKYYQYPNRRKVFMKRCYLPLIRYIFELYYNLDFHVKTTDIMVAFLIKCTPCYKLMYKETWEWFFESCWGKEVLFYISTFQLCTHVGIKCLIFVIRKKASREIEIIDYENYNHQLVFEHFLWFHSHPNMLEINNDIRLF